MSASPIRCACIDVGSNTTALLVADVSGDGLRAIDTRRHFTMLGEHLGPAGFPEEKISEVVDAVQDLLARARELGAERCELIATQAVREAPNGPALAEAVERAAGQPLELISGNQEARYSFLGAVGGMQRVKELTAVVDVGGGSTEISWCEPGGVLSTVSFAIGSARLQREFFHSDPPSADELRAAHDHVESVLSALAMPSPKRALAVGGGATTAKQLAGGILDGASVARVQELVAAEPSAGLAEHFNLHPDRARLLPAGLAILGTLSELLGSALEVGLGGLREGVLIDRMPGASLEGTG